MLNILLFHKLTVPPAVTIKYRYNHLAADKYRQAFQLKNANQKPILRPTITKISLVIVVVGVE